MSDHSPHFCESLKIEEAKVDLPHEILLDIVLRLPIKSIITWTSVSKSWNSLIKNPKFISTHLNHNSQNHTQLLFLRKFTTTTSRTTHQERFKEIFSLNWDNEAFDEYTRFDLPFPSLHFNEIFHIVGACNGLVCLANFCSVFVWNPMIRKYVISLTFSSIGKYYAGCGFGFDSKTNDYMMVRILDQNVEVYSLATGEWKMVGAMPRKCVLTEPRQAFVNGALHWAAYHTTNDVCHNFILAFDLGDENVREIMLPKDLLIRNSFGSCDISVSVFGESLAMYSYRALGSDTDIWVMKEYGVLESWTKVFTVDSQGDESGLMKRVPEAVGFRNSGEVVMEVEKGKLVSLDPEQKKIKDLSLSVPYGSTFVEPYVESLVLLDNSEGAVSY